MTDREERAAAIAEQKAMREADRQRRLSRIRELLSSGVSVKDTSRILHLCTRVITSARRQMIADGWSFIR